MAECAADSYRSTSSAWTASPTCWMLCFSEFWIVENWIFANLDVTKFGMFTFGIFANFGLFNFGFSFELWWFKNSMFQIWHLSTCTPWRQQHLFGFNEFSFRSSNRWPMFGLCLVIVRISNELNVLILIFRLSLKNGRILAILNYASCLSMPI